MITSEVIPGKNLLWLQRNEEMRDWWEVAEKFNVGASPAGKWRAATFPHHWTPWSYKGDKVSPSCPWGSLQSLCCVWLDKGL